MASLIIIIVTLLSMTGLFMVGFNLVYDGWKLGVVTGLAGTAVGAAAMLVSVLAAALILSVAA